MRPLCSAARTARMAASGSEGMSSVSAPASSARTQASPELKPLAMPPISSASVTTSPLKPKLLAQEVGQDGRGERGGKVGRGERGDGDVRGHDGVDAGLDGGFERDQLEAFEPFPVGGDGRQVHVRIDRGVAVSGEMFGGGERRDSSCRRARLR